MFDKQRIDAASMLSDRAKVVSKVGRRLIPFLFVMYVINYLDRINIGFAALSMNKDLALSATAYGFASTIFYIGYVACEVPSNLLMVRYGARIWLARILISWGFASAATMLVFNAGSLYVARFLVGVMEAGFVPGVLLYISYWFPASHRARANALLMIAQPVAMALGAGVSGLILGNAHGLFGLQGWRWLFLLEGLPAVPLGIMAYFYLSDRPEHAKWLTRGEAEMLNRMLGEDKPALRSSHSGSIWKQLADKNIVMLSLAYFCLVNTINVNATWIPTIVRGVLQTRALSYVAMVAAIPAVFAIILMPLWAISSDRKKERSWHVVAALALAALGWQLVIFARQPELRLLGLVFTTSGAFCGMSVFWTLPQTLLSETARPAGIAVISSVGLMGSASSPTVIGFLRDLTGNFAAGLLYSTVLLVLSMVLVLAVSRRQVAEMSRKLSVAGVGGSGDV